MNEAGRRVAAEGLGTGLLLFVIVGSGIGVERGGGSETLQLFAHAVAVGAGLAALIAMFAAVSGAHFNPAVTIGFWRSGAANLVRVVEYSAAQLAGAFAGVLAAHLTFGEPAFSVATNQRAGLGLPVAEFMATFVLVLLILGLVRSGWPGAVPAAVGGWVAAIIVSTSSTGFANPAVTAARALSDTFTGIAPAALPGFLAGQLAAGYFAGMAARFFFPTVVHHVEEVPTDVRQ